MNVSTYIPFFIIISGFNESIEHHKKFHSENYLYRNKITVKYKDEYKSKTIFF